MHRGPKPTTGNQGKRRKQFPAAEADKPAAEEHGLAAEDGEDDEDKPAQSSTDAPEPRKKGKKGKKFVESQVSLVEV